MLKLDTRDKKPKVWNIAIASAITLIVVFFFMRHPDMGSVVVSSIVIVVYLLVVLVFLVVAFFRQIEYNLYSYNTIYYAGFALFVFSVLVTHVRELILVLEETKAVDYHQLLLLLLKSAKNYMMISSPFILVFSILLAVSNISLIRHEGRRFVNLLGIILAVLMLAGEAVIFIFAEKTSLWLNLFAAFYLYFECMVIGAIIADWIAAKYHPEKNKDFLIILGCGIQKDGTPSPLLAGRVDRALKFYREQKELIGKAPVLIPSGGQGPDEVCPESEAMANYMLEQGIPEEDIIQENRSTSTFENMKFSKEIIDAIDPSAKVAYATTNYHVFRGGLYARRVKMRAVGMGARTKWYFWPNAAVREFAGLLFNHKGKQILVILGIVIVYVGLTYLTSRVI